MLESILVEATKAEPIAVSEYVRLCLYHPQFGYYTKPQTRVGPDGDFYTSSSLKGGVFSKLLLSSAKSLCAEFYNADFKKIEIGAEPERVLFEDAQIVRVGGDICLSGNVLLFSNELLDARPFDRFKFEDGKIFKAFVRFFGAGSHEISYKPAEAWEHDALKKYFDFNHEVFYLDFSFDALEMFEKICFQNWNGALVFADYFRTRAELADFPNGTARTYRRHRTGRNIFENPGENDITFSPPFEDFCGILKRHGFKNISCDTQAKFFFENAKGEIKGIIESAGAFSDEKRALSELLSPVHLGDNFRILSAFRG